MGIAAWACWRARSYDSWRRRSSSWRKDGSSSQRRRVRSATPVSRAAWARERAWAIPGRAACWRKGSSENSISRPFVGHFGPLCLTVGGGCSVGVEFGKFDFPAIVGHFGPLYLTVGGGCSVGVEFGKFDFPAIVGHFGPLCLTVGGGCSVGVEFGNFDFPAIGGHFRPFWVGGRVRFGIRVALGELGAWGLFLVFRHQTSRCLSGYLVLALVIWGDGGPCAYNSTHVLLTWQVGGGDRVPNWVVETRTRH